MKTTKDEVLTVPRGRKLPYWESPRSWVQSLSKITNLTREWVKVTEDTAYKLGKEFAWNKNRLAHGDFADFVSRTAFSLRTAQRLMQHARECDEVNRILPYHPSKRGGKSDTVSLLESPFENEKTKEQKADRPRHDSEPLLWSASETAQELLKVFEKLTERRRIEEMEEVRTTLDELVRDYIESRREEKLKISARGR